MTVPVRVRWLRLPDAGLSDVERDRLALDVDAATLGRVRRMRRPLDRDRRLAGHALLRRMAAAVSGTAPSALVVAVRCVTCGSTDHGKPYLALPGAPEVNLAHSGRVVAVVLAPAGTPVGIDVESRTDADWPALRRAVFTDLEWSWTADQPDPERARLTAWARKEAVVKATGHGLAIPLNRVRVDGAAPWTPTLTDPAMIEPSRIMVGTDLTSAPDHAMAVAAVVPAGAKLEVDVAEVTHPAKTPLLE